MFQLQYPYYSRKVVGRKHLTKHFPSKEAAIEWLTTFDRKLSKRYRCYLFTDKQYSLAKVNVADGTISIPFTAKQLREVYYLGEES